MVKEQLIGYDKGRALNRFNQRILFLIESGYRGVEVFSTYIRPFKIEAIVHIGKIVFLEDVSVRIDGELDKGNSRVMFDFLHSVTDGKLTDRLELLNALNKADQKSIKKNLVNKPQLIA